jgi:hypothetical protein
MSNQTVRKPPGARSSQGAAKSGKSTKSNRYRRQTARIGLEARRDGKPLINVFGFGWGGHLSRLQKTRIQRRALYSFFGVIIAALLGIGVFGLLQQNVLIPNEAIVSINGTSISQDTYRKYLAYQAQVLWNKLQSELKEQQALAPKVAAGDQAAVTRNQALLSLIQVDESGYGQSSITQNVIDRLTDDQLIQRDIQQFEAQHVKFSFAVKDSEVQSRLRAFKGAFPRGETYQQFLSSNNMSENDVLDGIRIDMRRDLMTTYLTSLLVSPAPQVHIRKLQLDTQKNAAKWLATLKAKNTDAEWSTLAKQVSLDATSKDVGGDSGWIFRGGTDGAIENWLFGLNGQPRVKVHELSPVIKDVSGTYDIVEALEIDPSRAVDPSQLSAAMTDALDHWLAGQRANPAYTIGTPNPDMMSASRNLPVMPDLNAALPNFNSTPTPSLGG